MMRKGSNTMLTDICGSFSMLYELDGMLYHYINRINMNIYSQRLRDSNGWRMTAADLDMMTREFARLEDIVQEVCSGIDRDDPLLSFFYSIIDSEIDDQTTLMGVSVELMFVSRETGVHEALSYAKQAWGNYRQNGYAIACDDGNWSIHSAPPSSNPDYLIKQFESLPYSKSACMKIYRLFSDFDNLLDELEARLLPLEVKLREKLAEDMTVRSEITSRWDKYLADISAEEFLKSIAGISACYSADKRVDVRYMSMRPSRLLYTTGGEGALEAPESYFICIGIGLLPEFSLASFHPAPDKVSEILRLLGDKTKFEVMQKLTQKSYYCLELANEMGMNAGHMSRNLNSMYYAGLLTVMRRGGRIYYSVNKKYIEQLLGYLNNMFVG